jgi:hypothetical protein
MLVIEGVALNADETSSKVEIAVLPQSRTPDTQFRNRLLSGKVVCSQCVCFGTGRALSGIVGSAACNVTCNSSACWGRDGVSHLRSLNNCPAKILLLQP